MSMTPKQEKEEEEVSKWMDWCKQINQKPIAEIKKLKEKQLCMIAVWKESKIKQRVSEDETQFWVSLNVRTNFFTILSVNQLSCRVITTYACCPPVFIFA